MDLVLKITAGILLAALTLAGVRVIWLDVEEARAKAQIEVVAAELKAAAERADERRLQRELAREKHAARQRAIAADAERRRCMIVTESGERLHCR